MIGSNPYISYAFHGESNSRILEDLHLELRRTDELLRLLEIRVEELEKSDRGLSIVIKGEIRDEA